jgi:hypothetical protein
MKKNASPKHFCLILFSLNEASSFETSTKIKFFVYSLQAGVFIPDELNVCGQALPLGGGSNLMGIMQDVKVTRL